MESGKCNISGFQNFRILRLQILYALDQKSAGFGSSCSIFESLRRHLEIAAGTKSNTYCHCKKCFPMLLFLYVIFFLFTCLSTRRAVRDIFSCLHFARSRVKRPERCFDSRTPNGARRPPRRCPASSTPRCSAPARPLSWAARPVRRPRGQPAQGPGPSAVVRAPQATEALRSQQTSV